MFDNVESVLEHYGIKGMKWGVRRKRGSDGRVGGESSDSDSSSSEGGSKGSSSGKSGGKGKTTSLSDSELRDAVNRMQLEKQYESLASERLAVPKTRGQKFMEATMKIGVSVLQTQAQRTANNIVGKAIDDKLIAKGLINKPKKKK